MRHLFWKGFFVQWKLPYSIKWPQEGAGQQGWEDQHQQRWDWHEVRRGFGECGISTQLKRDKLWITSRRRMFPPMWFYSSIQAGFPKFDMWAEREHRGCWVNSQPQFVDQWECICSVCVSVCVSLCVWLRSQIEAYRRHKASSVWPAKSACCQVSWTCEDSWPAALVMRTYWFRLELNWLC